MPEQKPRKKHFRTLSVRLTKPLEEQIAAFSQEIGESESVAVRMALRDYFLAKEGAKAALSQEQTGNGGTESPDTPQPRPSK
jgi:predicted DNA-binding protein